MTALGIGATTAVFSAIDAALIRPLPFPNPSQLYTINAAVPLDVGVPRPAGLRHRANIEDMAAMTDVFERIAVFAAGALNLTDPDNPLRINAGVVSHDFTDEHRTLLSNGSFAYVLHQDIHYCVLAAARVLRALCENVRGALNVVQPRVEILTAENLH